MPGSRSRRSPSASSAQLVRGVRISERDAHEEPVELRFGQTERAELLEGILRRDHEERVGQPVRRHVDADLPLFHRLEQRALRLRARAIHFVREQQLGEDRALLERERAARRVEHGDADDVGGQQVARELHALPGEAEHVRQRMRERRLADAGDVFDQEVAARDEAREREPHGVWLAEEDAVEGGQDVRDAHGGNYISPPGIAMSPSTVTRLHVSAELAHAFELFREAQVLATSSAARARSAATTFRRRVAHEVLVAEFGLELADVRFVFRDAFAQTLGLGFRVYQPLHRHQQRQLAEQALSPTPALRRPRPAPQRIRGRRVATSSHGAARRAPGRSRSRSAAATGSSATARCPSRRGSVARRG